MSDQLTVFHLPGLPDFKPGDDLAGEIMAALDRNRMQLEAGDILVVAHKVVSKSEGAIVDISNVSASAEAHLLADQISKDPRKVQVILDQSSRVIRASKRPDQEEGTLIAEHRLGYICANAAVDESNTDHPGQLITLPADPDASARALCQALEQASGVSLGVVISDTFGRPWRLGQVNVAIGLANVPAKIDLAGDNDAFGHELRVTSPAFADELAAASGLLMSKDGRCPVIIFRGLSWQPGAGSARDILRPHREDLFR